MQMRMNQFRIHLKPSDTFTKHPVTLPKWLSYRFGYIVTEKRDKDKVWRLWAADANTISTRVCALMEESLCQTCP